MFRNAAKPIWMFGGAPRGDRWGMEALKGPEDEKVQQWDSRSIAKLRNIRGNIKPSKNGLIRLKNLVAAVGRAKSFAV